MSILFAKHIEKTPGVCGGRACIAGHRVRVQDIVVWHEKRGYSPDEVVDMFPGITLADEGKDRGYGARSPALAPSRSFAEERRRFNDLPSAISPGGRIGRCVECRWVALAVGAELTLA